MNEERRIIIRANKFNIGFDDLLNGNSDIFFSNKAPDDIDRFKAREKGFNLIQMPMARNGSVLIVQTSSIVERLKLEDIKGIFSGEYTDWNSFSQRRGSLQLFVDKHDKTRNKYFKNSVLKNAKWSSEIVWVNSQQSVMDSVKENRYAMGLVGLSSPITELNYVKLLSITTDDEVISPVQNHYPLGYPIYFYFSRDKFAVVSEFVQFCSSKAGQKIALKKGAYPLM